MRNLQKILALALALIMSFSLVVTANAAFSDEADINETYSEAVNVLSGLEVFRGYTDGSYQPQASITRAEVAAIIYRIATGDVEDRQVSLYSDYNRFTDVASGSWYAGYVNYCANAEYIQGYGDGRFGPNDPVTGYQALAMILRAVGYGKMNEFTGSNWAVQTAARANTLKISRNVTAALLGSPASREVVAELLFRSILVPTVDYNQFNGYTETDTNLAANLGLEAVKGVVVANQEADLYSEEVMAEGKTNLEVAENDIRTLDYTTTLDDIGESRYAYIVDSKVLALGDTGENVKFETGDDTDVSTDKKFKDKSGLSRSEDTEFYLNFGREGHFSCDQRLEFTVVFYNATAEASFDKAYEDISKYAYTQNTNNDTDDDWTVELGNDDDKDGVYEDDEWTEIDPDRVSNYEIATGSYPIRYNRVIRAEEEITAEELEIIRGIFAAADNDWQNGKDKDKLTGDVYVGTKSTSDKVTDEERDLSNSISFRKFKDEYINSEAWDRNFDGNDRGEWLKIVDNNSDGKADYAFLTEYHLDEVIGAYTKSGETRYEYEILDTEDWDVVDYVDEVEVGTVVLTTEIDNKVTIKKAEILTDKIETVNFRDETVTTVGGETKKQSEIFNDTRMDETITNMDDGVEYNMYLDRFGNIRAYELAAGTKYALLTELYYDRYNNTQYVRDRDLIVEATAGEAKTAEFDVLNDKDGNDFLLDVKTPAPTAIENWDELYRYFGSLAVSNPTSAYGDWQNAYATHQDKNAEDARTRVVLQPAINNLALDDTKKDKVGEIFQNASTNVARYVQTDDGVRITTAAEYARDKSTNDRLFYGWSDTSSNNVDYTTRYTQKEWEDLFATNGKAGVGYNPLKVDKYAVYRYNYIELDCWDEGIAADQIHYPIAGLRALAGTDNVDHAADEQYRDVRSSYVNAVHDTEYYIVNRGDEKVSYFTDYENVKKIDPEYIEAVYAVAENTEYDNNEYDYWVANVIVIEVKGQIGDVDNISLAFSNYKQTTQRVKFLDTLTTKYEGVNAHVIPDGADWGPRWEDYGFYKLYDTEKDGDELLADDIVRINRGEYNTNGIYAGVVTRVDKVSGRGGYIDVDLHDANNSSITREAVTVKDGAAYLPSSMQYIYAIDGDEAVDDLTVTSKNNGDVRTGDHIIWVTKTDDAKTTYYIVVVSDKSDNDGHNHDWTTKSWLKALYADIISEQRGTKAETVTPSVDVIVSNAIGGPKKITAGNVVVKPTAEGGNWKISIANLNTAIGSIAGMSGYTADSFEITSDAKYHGEAVKSATHYEIPGVTGPVTVEVIAKGADVANAVTVTDKTGNVTELWVDGEKQTTTISGTPSGAMKAGTEIEVRFTTAADKIGYYSTTDGGAKMKAEAAGTAPDGKKIWKFTDTVRASALTYFVYGEADELYTFKTTDSTVTLSNANPMAANTDLTTLVSKVTVTAPLHYTVAVKDITIGEKKLTPTTDYTFNSANGEITFKNSLQLTGDVTIEVEKTPKTYTLTINARNFLDKIDGDTVGYTWTKDYTYTGKSMVLELTPKAGTVGLAIDIQDPANTATLANNKLTLTLEDDTTISLIAETDAAKLGRIETAVRTLTLKYESANPTASDLLSRIEMQIMDLVGKDGATVVDLVEKTGDTLANSTIDATTPTVTTKVQFKLKVGSATSASDIEMSVSVTDTQYKALKEAKDAVEALKAFTVNSAGTKDSTVDITSTVATDDIAAAIKENAKVKNIIPTVTVASDDTTNTAITDYDTVAAGSNVTGAAYTVTLKFDETKKVDASVTAATITNGADHD